MIIVKNKCKYDSNKILEIRSLIKLRVFKVGSQWNFTTPGKTYIYIGDDEGLVNLLRKLNAKDDKEEPRSYRSETYSEIAQEIIDGTDNTIYVWSNDLNSVWGKNNLIYKSEEYKSMKKVIREGDKVYCKQLLDRMVRDCKYVLGAGGKGAMKYLWAGNVKDQIAKMRELLKEIGNTNITNEKEIDEFEKKLLAMESGKNIKERTEPNFIVLDNYNDSSPLYKSTSKEDCIKWMNKNFDGEALYLYDVRKYIKNGYTDDYANWSEILKDERAIYVIRKKSDIKESYCRYIEAKEIDSLNYCVFDVPEFNEVYLVYAEQGNGDYHYVSLDKSDNYISGGWGSMGYFTNKNLTKETKYDKMMLDYLRKNSTYKNTKFNRVNDIAKIEKINDSGKVNESRNYIFDNIIKGKKESTVKIKRDFKIPGTDIILEKGDVIEVLPKMNESYKGVGVYFVAKDDVKLFNFFKDYMSKNKGGLIQSVYLFSAIKNACSTMGVSDTLEPVILQNENGVVLFTSGKQNKDDEIKAIEDIAKKSGITYKIAKIK